MATGIRVLVILGALTGFGGCVVGPQDDFPDQPGPGDRDNGDDPSAYADGDGGTGEGGAVDGDADADAEEPPADFGGYPDDGDFAAGADDGEDPDSEGGELGDELLPRILPPTLPPIPPPSSDFGLERSDNPAPPATDDQGN